MLLEETENKDVLSVVSSDVNLGSMSELGLRERTARPALRSTGRSAHTHVPHYHITLFTSVLLPS